MSIIEFQRGDKTALTKNFSRSEFQCPCGCGQQFVDPELAEKLQLIRDKLGKRIKITSGYRCFNHNQSVGGGFTSRHRYGMAAHRPQPQPRGPRHHRAGGRLRRRRYLLVWFQRILPRGHARDESDVAVRCKKALPLHDLQCVHPPHHPPGLYRGRQPRGHQDAPAAPQAYA